MNPLFEPIHPSWHEIVTTGLETMDPAYLSQLQNQSDWLPATPDIFKAFSTPLSKVRYILFGESPYPRARSANGYAFWDNAVSNLWCDTGLSKSVNRATSLRNLIKMLLVANGRLPADNLSQSAIAGLDKTGLVTTINALFTNMLSAGFLLLNASLVLSKQAVRKDALAWQPFIDHILAEIAIQSGPVQLVLFGKIAEKILALPQATSHPSFVAEHPYNLSFIQNPAVLEWFRPLDLLKNRS